MEATVAALSWATLIHTPRGSKSLSWLLEDLSVLRSERRRPQSHDSQTQPSEFPTPPTPLSSLLTHQRPCPHIP
ncbi:rCG37706 [Rattus norvegicus]|uniref:RCG37706 n=1 Tax=Rattus norvegicus TaxID=10116 RepID=A6JEV6_RAT|nr:rCG37706 [Rattus norvegicus]